MSNLRIATTTGLVVLLSSTSLSAATNDQAVAFKKKYGEYIVDWGKVRTRKTMLGNTIIKYEHNGVEIEQVYKRDTTELRREELEVERQGLEVETEYVNGQPVSMEISDGENEYEAEFENGAWKVEIEMDGIEYEGYLDDFDGNFDSIDLASLEKDDDDDEYDDDEYDDDDDEYDDDEYDDDDDEDDDDEGDDNDGDDGDDDDDDD